MALQKSVLSTVFIKSKVTATVNGDTAYDPTGDVVELAFKAPGADPTGPDWQIGSWETINGKPYARLLVGPAGFNLAVGTYMMWVKVTDNPEIPVMESGPVKVF